MQEGKAASVRQGAEGRRLMCRAASHSSGGRRCAGCSASARRAAYAALSPAEKATRNAARRAKAADLSPEQKAEASARRRAAYAAKRAAQAGDATATSGAVTIESLYAEDDRLRDEINAEAIRAHDADPNTFIEPSPEKAAEAKAAHERIAELREQRETIREQIDRLRQAAA